MGGISDKNVRLDQFQSLTYISPLSNPSLLLYLSVEGNLFLKEVNSYKTQIYIIILKKYVKPTPIDEVFMTRKTT